MKNGSLDVMGKKIKKRLIRLMAKVNRYEKEIRNISGSPL